jgi:hypothetical protein
MRTGGDRVRQPGLAGSSIVRKYDGLELAGRIVRKCDDGPELAFDRQRRCLCRVSAESQHLQ